MKITEAIGLALLLLLAIYSGYYLATNVCLYPAGNSHCNKQGIKP